MLDDLKEPYSLMPPYSLMSPYSLMPPIGGVYTIFYECNPMGNFLNLAEADSWVKKLNQAYKNGFSNCLKKIEEEEIKKEKEIKKSKYSFISHFNEE